MNHTPDEDWKVLNDWACSPETTELDHRADAFAQHPELSIFTPKSAAKGFYVGWVTGYAKALRERDEARAMVAELAKELDEISKFDKYDPAGPAALRAENALTKAQAFLEALHA